MRYYFDHNAWVPMSKEVKSYIISLLEKVGNPSSIHYSGRESKRILEQARTNIAKLVKCDNQNIIFTSGATEANNLALNGYEKKIISSIEHDSISNQKNIIEVDVDDKGYINLEMLNNIAKSVTDKNKAIISIMFANNETGIIQPVNKIKDIANKFNIPFHTDAVQAVGKIKINFNELGIDMLTMSSHKLGGPNGSGALIVSSKNNIKPILFGGQQEESLRSGTEPLLSIAGFGEAAKRIDTEKMNEVKKIKEYFEKKLKSINLGIEIIGENSNRLPNTFMMFVPEIKADTLLIALDLEGFEVSTGSACSSGKAEPSSVIVEMGFSRTIARGVIRISLGYDNTLVEVDKFILTLIKIIKRIKRI
jgi:cysteine desulfurase